MAEVEHATTTLVPTETVWAFVSDMDNWAAFVTGYQTHTVQNETESVWTLKGDVGVLVRTLEFRVRVTEWAGPTRVRFSLEGVNEEMSGEGSFHIERSKAGADGAAPAKQGRFARLLERVARLFRGRRSPARREATPATGATRLSFALRVDPGGPMAPMIEALMKPAMSVAAEDLASRIVAHLEERPRGDGES